MPKWQFTLSATHANTEAIRVARAATGRDKVLFFDGKSHEHFDEALVEFASGRRWTYAELDRDVNALARGPIGAGIEKGDRVGIWSTNCAEWVVTQLATAKAGLILVTINPAYRLSELEFALAKVGCAAIVTATAFADVYRDFFEPSFDDTVTGLRPQRRERAPAGTAATTSRT